ncbi:hypothetical protein AO286_26250 [Pseudomonas syringae]|nr:hypothetical protein AO286_26250 [Pseudomonas syringae]
MIWWGQVITSRKGIFTGLENGDVAQIDIIPVLHRSALVTFANHYLGIKRSVSLATMVSPHNLRVNDVTVGCTDLYYLEPALCL